MSNSLDDRPVIVNALRCSASCAMFCALITLYHPDEAAAQCEDIKLLASDGSAGALFGSSVDLIDDRIVVGAPGDRDMGAAYVYRLEGSNWVEEAKLLPADPRLGQFFGTAVAIDGDTILVGAPSNASLATGGRGAAYVFRRVDNAWVQEAKLSDDDSPDVINLFGKSVDLSNGRAVIGVLGQNSQFVYVYRRDGTAWKEEAKLDNGASGSFGTDVAIDGDLVLVLGTLSDSYVYFFRRSGTDWLLEDQQPRASFFYNTVTVDAGTGLAVANADRDESADTYFSPVVGEWLFQGKVSGGQDVSISGNTLLVGVPQTTRDSALVLDYDGKTSNWSTLSRLISSDGQEGDEFGMSVRLSGQRAVVGAALDSDLGTDSGAAYVFGNIGPPAAGTDCNDNLIVDACEIISGVWGTDCDGNGIPDDCDAADDTAAARASADCNENGIPDACDILDGFSDDCNGNSVPDECEPDEDCNNNGLRDICETGDGTTTDCNGNGVPDECEITADCNTNGVQDICDVGLGTSADCNGDFIPDECQPDEDCNENGTRDICDIGAGTSDNCNFDLVPDECQPDEDCNNNGTRDICDIGAGTSDDCNANLVPDLCDLNSGTSVDKDGDGRPDECCFLSATPTQQTIFNQTTQVGDPNIMNRYIGLSAGDPGVKEAIRLVIESASETHLEHLVGRVMWAGPKEAFSQNGSSRLPIPAFATYWVSEVQCEPYFDDWHGVCDVVLSKTCKGGLLGGECVASGVADPVTVCAGGADDGSPCFDDLDCRGEPCETDEDCGDGILNIYGAAIVPGLTVSVQLVSEFCNLGLELSYSDAVVMATSEWGDILRDCSQIPCKAADDGAAINDIFGMITRFTSSPGAPSQPRSDLEPLVANGREDMTDIIQGINAWTGLPYSYLRCINGACPGVSPTKACTTDADCQLEPCP